MVADEYILSSCKEPGFCGGLNLRCKAATTSAMQPERRNLLPHRLPPQPIRQNLLTMDLFYLLYDLTPFHRISLIFSGCFEGCYVFVLFGHG